MNAISVGTASVNWGFDPLYTWVVQPPFDRMLNEMQQAGYDGTEISYNFPEDAASLHAALDQRGLRAAATFCALNLRDRSQHDAAMQQVQEMADRLQALGSSTLILSDAPSPERLAIAGRVGANATDSLDDSAWRTMCEGLNHIAKTLQGRGMQAVFHPHVGTYVETESEIERLCVLTDPQLVRLCPDTGHLAYAGVAPESLVRRYANRIGYMHLKDVDSTMLERVRQERLDFVRAVQIGLFVELGTGMVNFHEIIDDLGHANYQGWMIVEQDAPVNPLQAAIDNRRYLRSEFGL